MILTETFFRKISGLVLPKESQALEATLGQAQAVLREAHSRGVELEGVREVRAPSGLPAGSVSGRRSVCGGFPLEREDCLASLMIVKVNHIK